jgi:hypothetical protein
LVQASVRFDSGHLRAQALSGAHALAGSSLVREFHLAP